MPASISLATIQMEISPAPTAQRLARAEKLVAAAAQAGAQLALLPELFNSGYRFQPGNFTTAEAEDGPTLAWLAETARRLDLHLGGSLLLREGGDIFNAFYLFAPDGKFWRYDKNYPWGWERAYFRGRRGFSIAQTDLGDIGMLVCWDAAHPDLWRRYAGQVDLMLVCACPPRVTAPTLLLPDGSRLAPAEANPLFGRLLGGAADQVFLQGVPRQTAWLGVPTVQSTGGGVFHSPLPAPRPSLLLFLPFFPRLARYLPQAERIEIQAAMTPAGAIFAADGLPLVRLHPEEGDSFTVAEVQLPENRPIPGQKQPGRPVNRLAYLLAPARCTVNRFFGTKNSLGKFTCNCWEANTESAPSAVKIIQCHPTYLNPPWSYRSKATPSGGCS